MIRKALDYRNKFQSLGKLLWIKIGTTEKSGDSDITLNMLLTHEGPVLTLIQ